MLIRRWLEKLEDYIDRQSYTEHNPEMVDGFDNLLTALRDTATESVTRRYDTIHRVLAEGNFVLSMCEGALGDTHCSSYDLYRLDDGRVVEHWDTVDVIAPKSEGNNDNGKF